MARPDNIPNSTRRSTSDLTDLDAELAHLEQVYRLAAENQMHDLITEMDREVRS